MQHIATLRVRRVRHYRTGQRGDLWIATVRYERQGTIAKGSPRADFGAALQDLYELELKLLGFNIGHPALSPCGSGFYANVYFNESRAPTLVSAIDELKLHLKMTKTLNGGQRDAD